MAPWIAPNRATAEAAVVVGCIALSAQPGRGILRETSVLVLAGLLVGTGLAYAAAGRIARQLLWRRSTNPVVLTAAAVLLPLVAPLPCTCRRAPGVDPMSTLRQEREISLS